VTLRDEESARVYVASQCDAAGFTRLERLVAMLVDENGRQNLIARNSVGQIWQRHIADSVQLLRFVSRETGVWLDIGSGAGFPGLVLAAIRPDWPFRLVELRKRRVEWLKACIAELGLNHCAVLGERLERIESFPAAFIVGASPFAPLGRFACPVHPVFHR